MKKQSQRIERYMTHAPHTINSGMPVGTAKALMKKHGVRHLPVQVAGHLVGVVSERDLFLAASLHKEDGLLVDDVMTSEPYCVKADAPLGEVVEQMAMNRYGCAIVCNDEGRAIGIFTAVDALRALSDKLSERSRKDAIGRGSSP